MRSISQQAKPKKPFWFFFLFWLVVSAFICAVFIWPAFRVLSVKRWVETPCVVESSRVKRQPSTDSRTNLSIAIRFHYTFNGHEYQSDRFAPVSQFGGGGEGEEATVRRYPPGRKAVCYVNPKDPAEAFLERGFTGVVWFGLVGLLLILVGAIALIYRFNTRSASSAPAARAPLLGERTRSAAICEQATALRAPGAMRPTTSPLRKFFAFGFVSLFWNTLALIFGLWAFGPRDSSEPITTNDWILRIVVIFLGLVGLFVSAYTGRAFLALFNPRPRLWINRPKLALGDTLELEWRIEGRVEVLRRLSFFLEGYEQTDIRSGPDSNSEYEKTEVNTFFRLPIHEVTGWNDIRAGRTSLVIPTHLVPTFEAPNNRIDWVIRVHGEIANWPDISEEISVRLLPAKPAPTPASSESESTTSSHGRTTNRNPR